MKLRIALVLLVFLSIGFTVSAQQAAPQPPQQATTPKPPQQATHAQNKKRLHAKSATAHSVVLTWTQGIVPTGSTCSGGTGSTAITGNAVFRSTTPGNEGTTPYATLTSPATTYTDAAVTGGITYYYMVTATNCNGTSPMSNEASALVPNPLVPNAPTGLTGVAQ